jgi:lipoprotein-anchoring transpeptidase ErfK/SrfK
VGSYTITDEDTAEVTGPTPSDYAEMAQLKFLGYASTDEALAEKFHMDIDLLHSLNPNAQYAVGETIVVADVGGMRSGTVAWIQADKNLRQLRAYGEDGTLIAAYPATIGSEDNPSPTGTHMVEGVAPMPNYTYNPKVNFQQGDNTEVLTIPPGPNGPVGSMWIDLSEPTYGIHGTPEPSLIDKRGSHGCVRLTNWDAQELAQMVAPGVPVEFLG